MSCATSTTAPTFDEEFFKQMDEKHARKNMSKSENVSMYAEWVATSNYEEDMAKLQYNGPTIVAEAFHRHATELRMPKDALILDVAAGNGLVAKRLNEKYGYSRFEAVDGCQQMLDDAPSGLYEKRMCAFVIALNSIPAQNDTYDAVVSAGAFAESHMHDEALHEVFRVLKPGGLMVNEMRQDYLNTCDTLRRMPAILQELCDAGKIERIAEETPEIKHMAHFDSLVQVYRKL